jgi:hypothetical protein
VIDDTDEHAENQLSQRNVFDSRIVIDDNDEHAEKQ